MKSVVLAILAENEERFPATKFAKIARKLGFAGCTTADVREAIPSDEWHHSSKFYNRVNYYDTFYILSEDEGCRDELGAAIKIRKEIQKLIKTQGDGGVVVLKVKMQDGSLQDGSKLDIKSPWFSNYCLDTIKKLKQMSKFGFCYIEKPNGHFHTFS